MKKATYKDISDVDLAKALREKRETLRAFRFASSGAKVKNVHEGRNVRRDVARILTELERRSTSGVRGAA
ncbi:MAG: 50S ribosomal protein L29 [bacterium]|nr:50S ribosomal protein L29 [bacterium]MDZ4285218.1 50S ribosomal protein L29 [Patescibacteria group bacterium]